MIIKPEEISKILFINIAHIGDIVISTPVIRALKTAYPHAQIDVLCSALSVEAVCHNPYIGNVFVYDVEDWQRDRVKLQKFVHLLQQQKYDWALTPCYGTLDPMLSWLSGAKYRAGFASNENKKFLTHIADLPRSLILHEREKQLAILSVFGISPQGNHIEFIFTEDETASLQQKLSLSRDKPWVLLCPFSRDPQKDWLISHCGALLQKLCNLAHCILIGSGTERAKLQKINASAGNTAIVLAGCLTLGELAALIDQADLFICVDTGPLHISQAFKTPVLALFGPTDPHVWGPCGSCDVILRTPKDCAPCWPNSEYLKKHCLKNECMEQITPTNVLLTAIAMLEKHSKHANIIL